MKQFEGTLTLAVDIQFEITGEDEMDAAQQLVLHAVNNTDEVLRMAAAAPKGEMQVNSMAVEINEASLFQGVDFGDIEEMRRRSRRVRRFTKEEVDGWILELFRNYGQKNHEREQSNE
jgi:hypothetical protein